MLSTISLAPARDEEHKRVIWLWDGADWAAMKLALATTAWNTLLSGDPHYDVTTFTTGLHSLQQQHVPHRQYCTSPKDQPWFRYRFCVAAEQKHRAWMRHKRHPTQENKSLHRIVCKTMTRTAKWAKARWENNIIRRLSSNQVDPKQWWSMVKERHGVASQERIPSMTKPDGDMAITSQDKADHLAREFSQKMRIPEPDRQLPTLPRLVALSLESVMISEEAVRRHLKSVNTKKASGPDGVSPHLLKHCTRSLVMIFHQFLLVRV